MRICTSCGRELPDSSFGKNHARPDGLQTQCRDCINHKSALARQKRLAGDTSKVSPIPEIPEAVSLQSFEAFLQAFKDSELAEKSVEILDRLPPRLIFTYLKNKGYVWEKMQLKTITYKDVII